MSFTELKPLFPTFLFLGGGCFLLLVSALGSRAGLRRLAGWMGALVMGGVAVFGAVALWLDLEAIFWVPSLLLAALYGVFCVLPSQAFGTLVCAARTRLSPRWRCRLLLLACGVAALVSLVPVLTDDGSPEVIEFAGGVSPEKVTLDLVDSVAAFTDRGHRVTLKTNKDFKLDAATLQRQSEHLARQKLHDHVIHVLSGWENCNCHGWVFTGGRFWVLGSDVDQILDDNGYAPVISPLPGDVAVYRDGAEKVIHTGIVRCLDPDSNLILVESKWGGLGRFIHPHDVHGYAAESCVFYRSSRPGHRLRGIPFESHTTPEPAADYVPARPMPVHS
ncbi:MAG: hypothetical protein U0793_02815 [Gemmataceae bacterium]